MIQKMFVNTAEGQGKAIISNEAEGLGKAIISNEKTRLARRSNILIFLFFLLFILSIACLGTKTSETMELKYCSVKNDNCKELNGLLSSQQSHLGIVDIGYYSFSYYEITNDKKLLNAKVYTWDELYDIIGCPAETLCPVNSINYNDYYNRGTKACKTICPSVLSCKNTGNNAYILTIVVTVLLGLILVIYCVYGVGSISARLYLRDI